VREIAHQFGAALMLPEGELRRLRDAAYLHDLGKIVLPADLLLRSNHLDKEEVRSLHRHPVIGYRILNTFDDTLDLAELVLAHQENWDGSGYPKGLKGEEIPKLSQIIALCGYYERKLYDAAGFKKLSRDEALDALRKEAGVLFDPQLVKAFEGFVPQIEV